MDWSTYWNDERTVKDFRGDFFFLSNMSRLETAALTPFGRLPTTEHIYMFYKSKSEKWKELVASRDNPFTVKKASNRSNKDFVIADYWDDEYRLKLMSKVVDFKFGDKRNQGLSDRLKALKDFILIEGNKHHDVFFGAFEQSMEGDNFLGILLMRKCDQLNNGDSRYQELLAVPEFKALVDRLPELGELQ